MGLAFFIERITVDKKTGLSSSDAELKIQGTVLVPLPFTFLSKTDLRGRVGSQVEIAKNTVNNHRVNGADSGHAIFVTQNSGVDLPDVLPTGSMLADPNDTTGVNSGIRCTLGDYANGHTGSVGTRLRGSGGTTSIDVSCSNALITL